MVQFLDPEILEKVDKSFMNLQLENKLSRVGADGVGGLDLVTEVMQGWNCY